MFDAIFGQAIGTAMGMIEAHKRRTTKFRIKGANTERALIILGPAARTLKQMRAAEDYLEELRTQAKWDAEKCANQQSKNI